MNEHLIIPHIYEAVLAEHPLPAPWPPMPWVPFDEYVVAEGE